VRERRGKETQKGREKQREGNANVRPHNPSNEAFASAGQTQLRDPSTAAAGEREKGAALHVTVTLFDGLLARKRWRGETKRRMEGLEEEMQEVAWNERPTFRKFRGSVISQQKRVGKVG